MAKFIKSIFSPPAPENRMTIREHEYEEEGNTSFGDRNKLSMSRSGRLRHANKKRHSLHKDTYDKDDEMQQTEKPKSLEYHVHHSAPSEPKENSRRKKVEANASVIGSKSPEEEIDSAFEIIDKS